MSTLTERISKAVAALRAAGYQVEAVAGTADIYRVNGGDAVTGPEVLVLAIRLGLMVAPSGQR